MQSGRGAAPGCGRAGTTARYESSLRRGCGQHKVFKEAVAGWIYKTYFSGEERIGLGLELEPRHQPEVFISLLAVSLIRAVLTAIYLWSVR
jgi:hypothetical protein